jgi:hypothetical protein
MGIVLKIHFVKKFVFIKNHKNILIKYAVMGIVSNKTAFIIDRIV